MTKLCTKCKEVKNVSEFHSNRSTKDGYHGWCKKCSNEIRRGQPKKQYPRSTEPKTCPTCSETKSPGNFWRDKCKLDGLHTECKECARDRLYQRNFGISLSEYSTLLESQMCVCAMCGKDETENNQRLCVDHCHETGKVRGLLCNTCNTGLGLLQDNTQILENGISYLRKHRKE